MKSFIFFAVTCIFLSIEKSVQCTVPTGYVPGPNGRLHYKLITTPSTGQSAMDDCAADGAWLAMFKTGDDFSDVLHFRGSAGGDMWTGVMNFDMSYCKDAEDCRHYGDWADGSKKTIRSYFAGGTYDFNSADLCTRFLSNGIYKDRPCSETMPYLCQFDCANPYKGRRCSSGRDMPEGFYLFRNHFYKLTSTAQSKQDNEAECAAVGAKLAKFDTKDTYIGVKNMFSLTGQDFFVDLANPSGLSCSGSACTGLMRWSSDGSPFTFDAGFMTHNVRGDAVDTCIRVTTDFKAGEADCDSHFVGLCQFRRGECPPGKIGSRFFKYEANSAEWAAAGSSLRGSSDLPASDETHELACASACVNSGFCQAFIIDVATGICRLGTLTHAFLSGLTGEGELIYSMNQI